MKFESHTFKCDVDVYRNNDGFTVRFYDRSREQTEDQIVNLVIVQPPFGYLSLKFIGDSGEGLLSGFLSHLVFTEAMVQDARDFIERLAEQSFEGRTIGSIPSHITLVKESGYVEDNGEY